LKNHWLIALIFLSYIAISVIYYRSVPGDDLSSSYIACRLLIEGEVEHLYSFDPEYFHIIDDPVWIETARKTSFHGFLHPYVQTPLWAYVLQPLCKITNFQTFNLLFLIINFFSIVAIIWLVAHHWAPSFLVRPILLVGALLIFSLTTPASYTAYLNQTHPLFIFATMLAVFLSSHKRDAWAGLVLAIATLVKITPALIAIHWLITGRRKSVYSFLLWSLVLAILALLLLGEKTILAYWANLYRISDVLLISFNNQSFTAWLYGSSYNLSEIFNWRIYHLPTIAKLINLWAVGLIVLYIAIVYRTKHNNPNLLEALSVSSLLIVSTIFTSIAWTHYYIILVVPLLILINIGLEIKNIWYVVIVCIIILLNVWPIAVNPVMPNLYPLTIIRSHFYSGVISLFTLLIASRCVNKSAQELSRSDC